MVEVLVRKEIDEEEREKEDKYDIAAIHTDDENEDIAYEEWKVRELRRIKRDKDEEEAYVFIVFSFIFLFSDD
jgi:microfibrillar-associated protein 1